MTKPRDMAAAREARIERCVLIGKAMSHRIRIEVLLSLDRNRDGTSPPQLKAGGVAPGASNPHLNYHVAELRKVGCLLEVGERAVRGATEHFYVLTPFGHEVVGHVKKA